MLQGFTSLPLADSQDMAELQTLLRIPLPADWQSAWTTPGQYVKVAISDDDKPGFFVIANAPGGDSLELLIKEASPLTAALRSLPVGSEVQVAPPQGKGFPVQEAADHDVLLLASGSGIAAIRPVLQSLLRRPAGSGSLRLVYGERTPQRVAFWEETEIWRAAGVEICVTLSGLEAPTDSYAAGYVQDHLPGRVTAPMTTIGYLSGMEAMLVACREAFAGTGGDPARLFTNF